MKSNTTAITELDVEGLVDDIEKVGRHIEEGLDVLEDFAEDVADAIDDAIETPRERRDREWEEEERER